MSNFHFMIEGDKESGKYIVHEIINGDSRQIFEINGKYYGGLKASRQKIGEHLQKRGYHLNDAFSHQCVKPGRGSNPIHEWTVEEYFIGVPIR